MLSRASSSSGGGGGGGRVGVSEAMASLPV